MSNVYELQEKCCECLEMFPINQLTDVVFGYWCEGCWELELEAYRVRNEGIDVDVLEEFWLDELDTHTELDSMTDDLGYEVYECHN